jgi:hypothetical protein
MELTELAIGAIYDRLFTGETAFVYAILDGASVYDLPQTLQRSNAEYECLFPGRLEPDMEAVAPYLVKLEPDSELAAQIVERGWGEHWGVFAHSDADMLEMRLHLRPLLIVRHPDGNRVRFRYYDPRVMRLFLPTCTTEELETMFGPIQSYLLEDEDPNHMLRFRIDSGVLRRDSFILESH